jgi:Fe(3+) dicitrate transport protein
MRRKAWVASSLAGSALVVAATSLQAQSDPDATRAPEVVIEAAPERGQALPEPFLPPVEGTAINSGKKTAVIDLENTPKIVNHNYREALAATPGLVLAEDVTPLLSVGYRGLNPYRSQFTQVLEDGIPITMDMFGYPEAYYTPPLEAVKRIEFLHGGASLMYGPQPGGSLNYITYRPRADTALAVRTQHVFGSDNLYSTYDTVSGTKDRLGHSTYFYHRQTDGFRRANSDVDLFAGSTTLVLDGPSDSRWILRGDGYEEEHGEPGGLTLATGRDAVNYNRDRNAVSRRFDRFRLQRAFGSLAWEKDLGEGTELTIQSWGRYYNRLSRRQLGGGFGTLPSGPTATNTQIQLQEFYNQGVDGRLRRDWAWGGYTHTLAGGATFYHTDSPRVDKLGAAPDATDGAVRNRAQRAVFYVPAFVQNLFRIGQLSVTPGVRLENILQSVRERVNVAKTAAGRPLSRRSEHSFVPLVGLGLEYELRPRIALYANVSQAYRPKLFAEAVPTEPTIVVKGDLKEGRSWEYEIGERGNPTPYLNWDTSLFLLDFSEQIGSVTLRRGITSVENVGRAIHKGAEAALQLDLVGFLDARRGTDHATRWGSLSVQGNVMLLDAGFVGGPQKGNTPQYAPEYVVRTGVTYRWRDRVRAAVLGTLVDDAFADDNNTAPFLIPAYSVWDARVEATVHGPVSVIAGINNLLDTDYYARIRSDGIDPAYRRNYYGGFSIAF